MARAIKRDKQRPEPATLAFAATLAVIALLGGSSKADVLSLIVLRPVMVIAITGFLLLKPAPGAVTPRVPVALLGLLTAVILVQLLPLPPALWSLLPHRARYLEAATLAGVPQPWRPLSIVPMLTLNSALALLPAWAVLLGFSRLSDGGRGWITPLVAAIAAVSAVWGILQLAGGADSPLYQYDRMDDGLPVGLFSNRNHQAAMLAASLPFIAIWARGGQRSGNWFRLSVGGGLAALALLTLLATGSRSGFVLTALGLAGAGLLLADQRARGTAQRKLLAMGVALAAMLALVAWWAGRTTAIARFEALHDPTREMRYLTFPISRRMAWDYLPWGSGFGTFDPLFRSYEPDALLKPTYFNNAHNDLLELAITGGIPGLIVGVLLLIWLLPRIWRAWRGDPDRATGRTGTTRELARASTILLAIFLLASLSDYPLRTPLVGALFALGCAAVAAVGPPARHTPSRL